MARCLIIGGNGFIGAHLAMHLSGIGHDVEVFDRFSKINPTLKNSTIKYIKGDFFNTEALLNALEGRDYIFHFMTTETPQSPQNKLSNQIELDLSQTVRLFEAAASSDIAGIFYASSGGTVYGDQRQRWYAETAPLEPISNYGMNKLVSEQFLDYFRRNCALPAVALRISNPYGPGQNPPRLSGLIPKTLHRIKSGQAVVRQGDGTMVRDYIYIDDLVSRIALMLDQQPVHSVYNLGSGEGHTVNKILQIIRDITEQDFDVVSAEQPSNFVQEVILDVSRFEDEYARTSLTPVTLSEGIRRTWDRI